MAAPTFVSQSSVAWGTGRTTTSIPVPTGVVAADVVVVHFYTEDSTPTVTPPSGFTELTFTPTPQTTGQIQGQRVFWKRATGADSGTYDFTHATARSEATAAVYRGAATTGSPVVALGSAVSNTQINPGPSVSGTTSSADNLLLWGATWYSATADTQSPTGFTEVYDGNDLETGYKAQSVAGATGSITPPTAGTTSNYAITLVGLAPSGPSYVASYGPASPTSDSTATLSTTASITCAAGDLLLVSVGTGNSVVRPSSVSGGGLTWSKLVEANSAYTVGNANNSVFYAVAASAQTFTATVTVTDAATSGHGWNWQCQRWANAAIGASTSAAASTGTASLTTTQASSPIFLALSDFNAVAGARTYSTATAGAFTETYANVNASEALNSGYYASAGAAGAKTVGITAPTGTRMALIAVELVTPSSTVSNTIQATASATASVAGSMSISTALQATGRGLAAIAGQASSALSATGRALATVTGTSGNTTPTSTLRATASATASFTAVTPIVLPPAPTPDPIPPAPVAPRRMAVTVYQGQYARVGQVPNYQSCSVTWTDLGVGAGSLVVGEDDPVAATLLQADSAVVAVVVDVGGVRWSGRVANVGLEREGPPGSGTITATLVDEWVWLQRMLASQNGASSSLASMPQYDTRVGPVVSVAADYINAAATRLGVPVVATKPASDTSPSVTLKARMDKLDDLLTDPLRGAGVTMTRQIWLPGDTQPPDIGTPLTTPTVVFAPRVLADKPWLQWNDSQTRAVKLTFQGSQPLAYRVVVGLGGTDAARVYDQVIDTTRATGMGSFALPEIYTDASEATLGTPSAAAGISALLDAGGQVAAAFEVADGAPFYFGTDYVVGDVATIGVGVSTWREKITKLTVEDSRSEGLVITPVIGDSNLSGDDMMVQALARVAESVRSLQAGK